MVALSLAMQRAGVPQGRFSKIRAFQIDMGVCVIQSGTTYMTEKSGYRVGRLWHRGGILLGLWLACLSAVGAAFPASAQSGPQFTAAERAWIKRHPVVRIAVEPEWRPIDYLENGKHAGLSAEYLAAVERASGLRFKIVPNTGWSRVKRAVDRAEVDLLPAVSAQFSAGRLGNDILVTTPYYVASTIVITRDSEAVVFQAHRLEGKIVALKGGGALEAAFRNQYPGIKLISLPTTERALELVANGSVDAAVGLDAATLPVVRRKFFGRLHVSGTLPEVPAQISMGIRKDLPLLASIVEKSLNSLNARQTDIMLEKWLEGTNYGEPTPESVVRYYGPQIALILGVLVLLAALAYFALRAREAARRSERDKAMFLAIIGHEIRTPMHAILSSVELLQRTALDDRQAKLSNVAITASESLIALLDDVLEFSKLEARKVQLEKIPTALLDWAHQTLEMVRWRAEAKGLGLTLESQFDPNLIVDIDPTRLRQILLNLLANAIKFTEHGLVRVRLCYPLASQNNIENLTIEVHDTGIGIAPQNQAHIFDAFKQEDIGTTRRFGGTGLGLAICRELVTLMNGTICVRSEPGVFTVFKVKIPARKIDQIDMTGPSPHGHLQGPDVMLTDHAVNTPAGAPTGAGKILVVDDHELARYTIGQQFASLGREAAFAETGTAALQRVASERFDMILLDCDLPDIDGYTVAQRIRDHEAMTGRYTPIIAISASTDQAHQGRCISSGMDGVLAKPIRLDAIRNMLDAWCAPAADQLPPPNAPIMPEANDPETMFRKALEADLAMLEVAIASADWSQARHAAHRIKGAALIMGHQDIADASSELEALITPAANDLGAVKGQVARLIAQHQQLQAKRPGDD